MARRRPANKSGQPTNPVLLSFCPAMRPLSASEAIGPALERTKDVLTRPFRWQTFLKLAAVAFFAEVGGGFNFPSGAGNTSSSSSSSSSNLLASSSSLKPGMIAILVIVGLVFFVIRSEERRVGEEGRSQWS